MKTTSPTNKVTVPGCGWARFYKKPKAKSQWKSPGVPEFLPNWLVRFNVLNKSWEQSAVDGEVCFPWAAGLRDVMVWAKERIRVEAHLLQNGRLTELRAMREAPLVVSLERLGEVYLANIPAVGRANYVKNLARLRRIGMEMTGLPEEDVMMTDAVWTRERLLGWVRMRQEQARRLAAAGEVDEADGEEDEGEAADVWPGLRADLVAGRVPGVDKSTVMECNTTIRTYLRCAKAVFANRREYLPGLVLPELADLMNFSVDLAVPEGHREIPVEAWTRIWQEAPALREENAQAWALLQVLAWTGCRPVQALRMTGAALRVEADGYGIQVPAAKRGAPVLWPVAPEMGAALLELRTEGSLIGARTKTAGELAHRRLNEWLRERGLTGTHGAYMLRHSRGQQLRDAGGLELAAAGLGHKGTQMAERKYTANKKRMPMLNVPGGKLAG
jgi:integrase